MKFEVRKSSCNFDSDLHETRIRIEGTRFLRSGRVGVVRKGFNCFIFFSFLISLTEGLPSRHVNGDKIHHYSRQISNSNSDGAATEGSTADENTTVRSRTGSAFQEDSKYVVYANDLTFMPSYEPSVNPFLSHIEQAWKLKPHKQRIKKKSRVLGAGAMRNHLKSEDEETVTALPMDPNRPHFIDSNEVWDGAGDENKTFGDEEKNLREMFNVLFSDDYNL